MDRRKKEEKSVEERLNEIESRMDMLNGAWWVIKVLGSIAVGLAVIWTFLEQFVFTRHP